MTLSPDPQSTEVSPHIPANQATQNTESIPQNQLIQDCSQFWLNQIKRLTWIQKPTLGFQGDFTKGQIRWFEDGILNASVNCLDRHLPVKAHHTAFIWEQNDPSSPPQRITYQALYIQVCKTAQLLRSLGVKKGDRVCIYLPTTPLAIASMLACARIGAIHTVVFGGFSAEALRSRIEDARCRVLITTDTATRGQKTIPIGETSAQAIQSPSPIEHVILMDTASIPSCLHTQSNHSPSDQPNTHDKRPAIHLYSALEPSLPDTCTPEPMHAEDPLFILYTSGSTGKPKGIVHTTGGYLLYAHFTHEHVFQVQPSDVYWCTADIGWITGHSYVVYGPLSLGITSLIHSGIPTHPNASRSWEIIDTHQVTHYYTAPTAIRMLMAEGDEYLQNTRRDSLKRLGSVGEPINPEAWHWFFEHVGHQKCPIMDTWWQTETGGFMIAPPAELHQQKPGAAMTPMPMIPVSLLDERQNTIQHAGEGALCMSAPWPGMLRGIYGDADHTRLFETYFKAYPHHYFSGDKARRDADGDVWILGRMDDVLSIAGHRLGTAEVESALTLDHDVSEAAVIGKPDPVTGESIAAFIVLRAHPETSDLETLKNRLSKRCRQEIGPIASLKHVWMVPALPKTRSGKIMRRILRKLVAGEWDQLGDLSTLSNPESIPLIIQQLKQIP